MGDSPGKRLASFRNSLGVSQRAFGAQLGISGGLVGQVEADISPPSRGFLQKISERYGVSSDWLLNGQGEMLRPIGPGFKGRTATIEPPDYAQPGHGDLRIDGYDSVRIRRVNLSLSAGRGVDFLEGPDDAPIVVPNAWIRQMRISPDFTVMVRVTGDSMAPTVMDGSFILLHLMEKSLDQPGIYAFRRENEAYIKRLIPSDFAPDGRPRSVMVISDNPAYPPIALTGKRLNDIAMIGRVRAVFAML